ncbi:MAG: hypothetical protein ACXIUP_09255 [Microcella sp.]
MPTPDDIDRMLRADARDAFGPAIPLDASSIARGARRRRLPAQLGIGVAAVALVAGFGGVAIAGMPGLGGGLTVASDSLGEDASGGSAEPFASPDGDSDLGEERGGDELNSDGETVWDVLRCGEPLPPLGHTGDDRLTLELEPLDGSDAIDGRLTVAGTLTNVSGDRVELTTATHLVVGLARDGVVIWSTVGMDAAALTPTLGPDESQVYEGALELVDCGGTDPEASILDGSPVAGPGEYEVVAALNVVQTDAEGYLPGSVVVISPRASLVLP